MCVRVLQGGIRGFYTRHREIAGFMGKQTCPKARQKASEKLRGKLSALCCGARSVGPCPSYPTVLPGMCLSMVGRGGGGSGRPPHPRQTNPPAQNQKNFPLKMKN